jgi:bacterioferritin
MQPKKQVIDELNRFLRGRYTGIRQYEHLIERAQDPQLKEMLQQFQQQAKREAAKVAERIQNLGGRPVDGAGMMGEVRDWMQKWTDMVRRDSAEEILRDAYAGENRYGIHMSHRMVGGDLDPESTKLVDEILEEDQKRVDRLKRWLESLQSSSSSRRP